MLQPGQSGEGRHARALDVQSNEAHFAEFLEALEMDQGRVRHGPRRPFEVGRENTQRLELRHPTKRNQILVAEVRVLEPQAAQAPQLGQVLHYVGVRLAEEDLLQEAESAEIIPDRLETLLHPFRVTLAVGLR